MSQRTITFRRVQDVTATIPETMSEEEALAYANGFVGNEKVEMAVARRSPDRWEIISSDPQFPAPQMPDVAEALVRPALRAAANRIAAERLGDKASTREVKNQLIKAGRAKFYTCARECDDAHHGEWMYDLCWLSYPDGDPSKGLIDIALIAESEWHWRDPSSVREDFEKLMLGNAALKLMVFDAGSEEGFRSIADDLEGRARDCRRCAGDRYVLAGYAEGNFCFRPILI
jgi:hypothetical protein